MADALHTLSAADLGRRLAAGTLTSRALCEALIARYQTVNETVGAFTHLDQSDVLARPTLPMPAVRPGRAGVRSKASRSRSRITSR
jgi:Asp-tRNA(Asn)/Glu-tRNA(Gln) amidotransferase A subunit family amidase